MGNFEKTAQCEYREVGRKWNWRPLYRSRSSRVVLKSVFSSRYFTITGA
jgi:hypothetical protein